MVPPRGWVVSTALCFIVVCLTWLPTRVNACAPVPEDASNCCRLPDMHMDLKHFREPRCKRLCGSWVNGTNPTQFAVLFRGYQKSGTTAGNLMITRIMYMARLLGYQVRCGSRVKADCTLLKRVRDTMRAEVRHDKKLVIVSAGTGGSTPFFAQHSYPNYVNEDPSRTGYVVALRSPLSRLPSWYHFHSNRQAKRIPPGICEQGSECRLVLRRQAEYTNYFLAHRQSLGGLFMYTYEEFSEDRLNLMKRLATWMGFTQENIAVMEPEMVEFVAETSITHLANHTAFADSSSLTGMDKRMRARKGTVCDEEAAKELSRADVVTVDHVMCQASPFLAALFNHPEVGTPKCQKLTMAAGNASHIPEWQRFDLLQAIRPGFLVPGKLELDTTAMALRGFNTERLPNDEDGFPRYQMGGMPDMDDDMENQFYRMRLRRRERRAAA